MMHMVTYRSPEGQPVYHETESLEEAARHLEQLRNAGQGSDARIFRMDEVRVEVKTYYKVELPSDAAPPAPTTAPAAAASAPAPAASDAAAAPPAPATAAPPAPAAPTTVAAQKGEPAGVGANGGRFGLFGKG